jgi:type IV pilus assembly protein PilB
MARKIGAMLIDAGNITEEQLQEALQAQRSGQYKRVGEALIGLNFITEEVLVEIVSSQLEVGKVDLQTESIDATVASQTIEADRAKRNQIIPLRYEGNTLVIAAVDPTDLQAVDDIRMTTDNVVEVRMITTSDFDTLYNTYYGLGAKIQDSLDDDRRTRLGSGALNIESSRLTREAESAPIVRAVDDLLDGAAKAGASDIHIDPRKDFCVVLYRIDGERQQMLTIPNTQIGAVIARIKILANLDTTERRKPMDGRIDWEVGEQKFDIRVSTVPAVHGETVVMRLLNKNSADIKLTTLGFDEDEMKKFTELVIRPNGIILITGPTGSGKSTTLAAALGQMNTPTKRIMTAEDPVEYQLDGLNQVQINPKVGLTFATALRAFMRQDPDIIMVGEIRDYETADLAVNAAMTGHLVLSTLHTNDAPGAIPRINNLGVPPYLINATVIGVMGQRLVRNLCQCKKSYQPDAQELEMIEKSIGHQPDFVLPNRLYAPRGCRLCGKTGYKGRTGIFEIMLMTNELRQLIGRTSDIYQVKALARKQGMTTLFESGLRKVIHGTTSMAELLRVARPDYEDGVPIDEPVVAQSRRGLLAEAAPTLAEVETFSAL